MSNCDGTVTVLRRLDDSIELLKTVRNSTADGLNSFGFFEKSLMKISHSLLSFFNDEDPPLICKLSLTLLTRQAEPSRAMSIPIEEEIKSFSKEIKEHEQEVQLIRSKIASQLLEDSKSLECLYKNFLEERVKYDKLFNETHALVDRKNKELKADPLLYYNRNYRKWLNKRLAKNRQIFESTEQRLLEIFTEYGTKKSSFETVLIENATFSQETVKKLYILMADIILRYNTVLKKVFIKEHINLERTDTFSFIDKIDPTSETGELLQCIERRRRLQNRSHVGSGMDLEESTNHRGRYIEILTKLLTSHKEVSIMELLEFNETAQEYYEATIVVFERREKVIHGLQGYIEDMNSLCKEINKTFQKNTSMLSGQRGANTFCEDHENIVDLLSASFSTSADAFYGLSKFLSSQPPKLDKITERHEGTLAAFKKDFLGSLNEYKAFISIYNKLKGEQNELDQKISDIREQKASDEELHLLQISLGHIKNIREEQNYKLLKLAIQAAGKFSKAFENYRTKENSNFKEFSSVIKEVSMQEDLLSNIIIKVITAMDEDIVWLFGQENREAHSVQNREYSEPELNFDRGSPLPLFQKLCLPPSDTFGDFDLSECSRSREDNNTETKLEKSFGFKSEVRPMDSFACAIEQGMIRQGRMYVYDNAVCFSTYKIIGDIAIVIPVDEILKVEKKVAYLVFDTALSLYTKFGEIRFISFLDRDKAFLMIQDLVKNFEAYKKAVPAEVLRVDEESLVKESMEKISPELSLQQEEIVRDSENMEDEGDKEVKFVEEIRRQSLQVAIEQNKKKIQGLLIPDDRYSTIMIEEILPCTAVDLYNIAFSDRKIEYKGKTYENCWMIAKAQAGDIDIEYIKWNPKVPFEGLYGNNNNLQCLERIAEGSYTSERNFKYTHQVKEGGPFVPKICPVEEKHFGYWLGPDEFVLQNEIFTSKVPMSDTFVVKNCFRVKDIGKEKCSFMWRFHVEFVKSTMFKGKIAKSSQTENTEFATKIFLPLIREQMNIYLKNKR